MIIDRTVLDLVFPPEERGHWSKEKLNYRRDMIAKVAAAIGEPESFVSQQKESWAAGASYRTPLQWAARDEYGLTDAVVTHLTGQSSWGEAHRKFLRKTRLDSQAYLSSYLGIKELMVVRTMCLDTASEPELAKAKGKGWQAGALPLQPLSSFTLQPEMVLDSWGRQFGHTPYDSQLCVTIRATIPATQVWSVPGPGIGAKIDFEVILFGGSFPCEAIVHEDYPRPAAEIW